MRQADPKVMPHAMVNVSSITKYSSTASQNQILYYSTSLALGHLEIDGTIKIKVLQNVLNQVEDYSNNVLVVKMSAAVVMSVIT